ncbi:signal peptidase II [Thermocrinis sp.]
MERIFNPFALIYLVFLSSVFLLDLFTKHLAEVFIKGEIQVLPFLKLVLVYNKGVAFGMLSNVPDWLRIPVLLGTPPIAIVFTFFYAVKSRDWFISLSMGAIGGGALGNFYDRLVIGEVRDFIYLSYGKFSYPAFNVADAMISLGIVLMVIRKVLFKV